MKHNINGRLWGIGQFIFWLILIPWIIIIIPLNYYYETHTAPDWLANLYRQDWIKWINDNNVNNCSFFTGSSNVDRMAINAPNHSATYKDQ